MQERQSIQLSNQINAETRQTNQSSRIYLFILPLFRPRISFRVHLWCSAITHSGRGVFSAAFWDHYNFNLEDEGSEMEQNACWITQRDFQKGQTRILSLSK